MKQSMMRAIVWEGIGKLSLKQYPIPEISVNEVLVKVSYSSICATDIEIINGKFPYSPPYILGHEITGAIVDTGSAVIELKKGDRVVIDPAVPCNECFNCRSGKPEYCANYREIGINENGGWAEFVKVPVRSAHKIPTNMSDVSAAIFEPMACPFGAMDAAGLYPGEQVLIFGDGPAAMYFIQIARMMGAGRITVVHKQSERKELLVLFGADDTLLFEELENLIHHPVILSQGGFNVVIDAVGYSETVNACVRFVSTGGRIIFYGFKDSHTLQFPHRDIIFKGITIIGRTNTPSVWTRAIECVSRNMIRLDSLVENVVKPEEAIEILLNGKLHGLKTIIDWS
jgi:2-desacetyl-2-hydroxyethyl bacteriochlorophyllide A dehydrogenase